MARRDGLTDFNGTSLQPYSLLFGDIQQEQASSPHVSPEYSSRHRHSLSVSPEPRVSNGMHNKQRNRLVEESMTHASFDDLDQRIREAEEQIHLTYSRRLRTTPSQTDNLAQSDHHTITRKDLRFHARDSPMTASGSTMKPNTTLASVSARSSTRNGTYTKHPEDEINGHEEQRQKILGGSDGKRKPLPHEFRNGGSASLLLPLLSLYEC